MTTQKRIGLIFAMQEEQTGLSQHLQNIEKIEIAGRHYLKAKFQNQEIVSVLSGIGKVAAAITATTMLNHFAIDHIIMCGVAGAADASLKQGDLVIASELIQHDMDASPLFPRFEVPLTGQTKFYSDPLINEQLKLAARDFLKSSDRFLKNQIKTGLIASGDQFISDQIVLNKLNGDLPGLLAVEMEGASIAQVCKAFGIPFSVIRTISDSANDDASLDFQEFIRTTAAPYSIGILSHYLR